MNQHSDIPIFLKHLSTTKLYSELHYPEDFDEELSERFDFSTIASVKSYFTLNGASYWLYAITNYGLIVLANTRVIDIYPVSIDLGSTVYTSYDSKYMDGIMIGNNVYQEYKKSLNSDYKITKSFPPFLGQAKNTDQESEEIKEDRPKEEKEKVEVTITSYQKVDSTENLEQDRKEKIFVPITSYQKVTISTSVYFKFKDKPNTLYYNLEKTQVYYTGDLSKSNLPNGYGIQYNTNGKMIYKGVFKDGFRNGTGTFYSWSPQSVLEYEIRGTCLFHPSSGPYFESGTVYYRNNELLKEYTGSLTSLNEPKEGKLIYKDGMVKQGKFQLGNYYQIVLVQGKVTLPNGNYISGNYGPKLFEKPGELVEHEFTGEFLNANKYVTIRIKSKFNLFELIDRSKIQRLTLECYALSEEDSYTGIVDLSVDTGKIEYREGVLRRGNSRFIGTYTDKDNLPYAGKLFYDNNVVYDGEFMEGCPKSRQIRLRGLEYYFLSRNGANYIFYTPTCTELRFQGEVNSDSLPDGKGKLFHRSGKLFYEGEFKNGLKEGKGIHILQNGRINSIEAEHKNDEIVEGFMRYTDARIFTGTLNRQFPIKGTMEYPDGHYLSFDSEKGIITTAELKNCHDGKVFLRISDQICCTYLENQEFELDQPLSVDFKFEQLKINYYKIIFGNLTYLFNGFINFVDSKINFVFGILKDENGNSYNGNFKNMKPHGKGTLSVFDMEIYGLFENGRLVELLGK